MSVHQPVHNHVTTIFTSPLMVVLGLAFGLIALLTGQTRMAVLILLVLGLTTLARVWSRYGLASMTIDAKTDRTRVFPGESIRTDILVRNDKLLPVWLEAGLITDGPGFVPETPAVETGFLLWFQEMRVSFEVTAAKRGCFNMGQTQIVVSDLFRFFPGKTVRHHDTDIVVFPRIHPVQPLSLPERGFFGVPGARSPVQDPVYVMGIRDYQSFTPARHILWKAGARYGKLKEKVCEPSVQEKIWIVVDVSLFSVHGADAAFERMLEGAASMAVYFADRGNAVGFMTNAEIKGGRPGCIPVRRSAETLSLILETIARMIMKPASSLKMVFDRHMPVLWGANCIFCAHGPDPAVQEIKDFYAGKRIPVVWFVSDPEPGVSESWPDDIRVIGSVFA